MDKAEEKIDICLKHNQPIELIVMDKQIQPADSMLCFQCVRLNRQPLNQVVGLEQAQEMIMEKLAQQSAGHEAKVTNFLGKLTLLSQKMIEIRQQLLISIDSITQMIESWSKELRSFLGKNQFIDLALGIQLYKEDPSYAQNLMMQNNKTYFTKTNSAFQRLMGMERFQKCYSDFQSLEVDDNLTSLSKGKASYPITYQLVSKKLQEESCNAIAFNKSGSIMVAGSKQNLQFWSFDKGLIQELMLREGGGDWISCITFSKITQWFVTGDFSGNVCSWKNQQNTSEWVMQKTLKFHLKSIRSIILTKNEEQLITCDLDSKINVWKVDCSKNKIIFEYTLENKHSYGVLGLSLNLSENALVSCGQDKQLILWKKGVNNEWCYQSNSYLDTALIRVCFVGENQILVQQDGKGFTNVFQLTGSSLREQAKIQLQIPNDKFDCPLFPTLYNKNTNVIIQKSKRYVFMIRKQANGEFKTEAQPIDCETDKNYGTLTEDGQYLVLWNDKSKEIKIYKITYLK